MADEFLAWLQSHMVLSRTCQHLLWLSKHDWVTTNCLAWCRCQMRAVQWCGRGLQITAQTSMATQREMKAMSLLNDMIWSVSTTQINVHDVFFSYKLILNFYQFSVHMWQSSPATCSSGFIAICDTLCAFIAFCSRHIIHVLWFILRGNSLILLRLIKPAAVDSGQISFPEAFGTLLYIHLALTGSTVPRIICPN